VPDTAEHVGAMVALVPSEADLDRLALPGGEPREELHLTLAYLGDAVDIAPEVADALFGYLQEVAAETGGPVVANAFGVAYWNPTGPEPAWVLNVGDDREGAGPTLADVHGAVEELTENLVPTLPTQHSPWQPHVCIAYSVTGVFDDLVQRLGPITFDRLRLAMGGDVRDLDLGRLGSQAATIRSAAGGDAVPWHKVQGSGDCPTDEPWAVVEDGTDELEGCFADEAEADAKIAELVADEGPNGGCVDCADDADHFAGRDFASDAPWNGAASRFSDDQYKKATAACDPGDGTVKERCFLPHHEPGGALNVNGLHAAASRFNQVSGHDPGAVARAKAHLRSHYGEVGEDVPDVLKAEGEVVTAAAPQSGDCAPGYHKMPDGSCMSDEEMDYAARWSGVLCVEGTPTGDGREFSPDALDWANHMLLRWQKEGSHGGDHDVTVTVGRIDRAWRDGPLVRGEGTLDLMNPDGFEIRRRLAGGFAGGVSIDADDIEDADVELIWPEADAEGGELSEGDDVLNMLFGRPLKTVYHGGRVRAATLVDIPAFVEAAIALTGDEGDAKAVAASGRHLTAVSDAPWAYTIQMHRELPDDAYAWVAADGTGRLLPHHELAEGDLGPANVTACAAAIAKLSTRGTLSTVGEVRAAYAHLAQHLRDAGQVPPPLDLGEGAVTAAVATDAWRPSREWFKNPELTVPLGTVVTDDGRVYGHLAHWQDCHIGYEDVCVAPPREDSHPYFMTGEVVCADGSRVSVGQVTVGIGHAPSHYRAARAAEHYDDTSAVVADVAVGNDEHGIWMAGAIRPHAESKRVYDLRASGRVSGDWRRIGNQLRLVGVLGVNVGGFLMPNLTVRVASGVQTALVAAGIPRVGPPLVTENDLDRRALRLMMDRVAARVRGA
jgi:2'-5' RNA ligase